MQSVVQTFRLAGVGTEDPVKGRGRSCAYPLRRGNLAPTLWATARVGPYIRQLQRGAVQPLVATTWQG